MKDHIEDRLDIEVKTVYPYNYSAGEIGSFFFRQLKENKKIFGKKCTKCGSVYIPPRPVCGPCWSPCKEWVEVGPEGTIEAFTVVYFSFLDPMTGKQRPVPYGYAFIKLDGASSRLQHFINETDQKKLKVGQRVRPVFREERVGNLNDIIYFEVI